jgi:hypothetical protein
MIVDDSLNRRNIFFGNGPFPSANAGNMSIMYQKESVDVSKKSTSLKKYAAGFFTKSDADFWVDNRRGTGEFLVLNCLSSCWIPCPFSFQ